MFKFFISLAALILTGPLMAAEDRYVTDEFEVTMRNGTSTSNNIVRMLRSGETVTLLEQDLVSQYSLVETSDNKKGYVLSRFLMDHPAARESLQQLQGTYQEQLEQLNQQSTEIDQLDEVLKQAQSDNETLKIMLQTSEQELAEIQSSAADTLNILDQNNQLKVSVSELVDQNTRLELENSELKDTTRMDWFVRGAAVSLIAFVIGILITKIRWRKQDSWGSY
jgi:SH3 domain protein